MTKVIPSHVNTVSLYVAEALVQQHISQGQPKMCALMLAIGRRGTYAGFKKRTNDVRATFTAFLKHEQA
jgi:hypothetical protein